jgi:hypothetical protein
MKGSDQVRRLLISILIINLLSACARATPTPLPAQEIIIRLAQQMKALKGFHFVVVRTGAPAYLDANETLSLSRIEGDYVAPDQAQGQVRVVAPGLVGTIRFISLGRRNWETNYLTGEWWQCPLDQCFNPALLFDGQMGLQAILETDLTGLQLLPNAVLEELPGKQLYALSGKLQGEKVYQISWGLMGPETINTHLWVDPVTFELQRAVLEEPASDLKEATYWTIDFLNFNRTVQIQPPSSVSKTP